MERRRLAKKFFLLAGVVSVLVLILGASGIATLWEAVFADVGVTLIAIMNAVRIQKKISFTGNMRRYSNFEQTVRMLEKTGGLIFNIEGRTIYITEK